MNIKEFYRQVRDECAGLFYSANNESPLSGFRTGNTILPPMTAEKFLAQTQYPPTQNITEKVYADVMALQISIDGNWTALQTFLETHLTGMTVYSIQQDAPDDGRFQIFIVGLLDNYAAGVSAIAVDK